MQMKIGGANRKGTLATVTQSLRMAATLPAVWAASRKVYEPNSVVDID